MRRIVIRKIFTSFQFLCLLLNVGYAQQNSPSSLSCDNWLHLPSQPSWVNIGDLDIPGNKLTIEAQINIKGVPPPNGVIDGLDVVSKHTAPSNVNYLLRSTHAEISTTNGFFFTPIPCDIDMSKTYHVAMVYDGTTLKYYRNGFLLSQAPVTGDMIQNNFPTGIGFISTLIQAENFIGYINEVRIWNVPRTQSELRSYMNSSLPNPTTQTGLRAYYTFDNLLNKQGNPAWNGTLVGSAAINQTNPECTFVADSCEIEIEPEQIINDYTEIVSLQVCKNELMVSDASAFNAGDTVLIIQMKGAIVDSTNSPNFGTVTDYKNAGNYEFNYIKSKNGNSIELLNSLQRQYDFVDGKVQLVRVPYFTDYNVTKKLTCLPWDGSKGGVLVFNVQNNLTLNADIDVSGKGFRGGMAISNPAFTCNITNYFTTSNDGSVAARKGESIFSTNTLLSGRGKLANGGGGGNSTNSGGAGGGNGGDGGMGGNQFDGCVGPGIQNGGISGIALPYSNASNKIYLGGGGGAGHMNDNIPLGSGGNGGGIVIITANSIIANGYSIFSQGITPSHLMPSHDDGRSGGGAGGTILLDYNNTIGSIAVSVKGGNGDYCMPPSPQGPHGPGGGGGGGIFWINQAAAGPNLILDVNGGVNGTNTNLGNNPWGAAPGTAGSVLTNLVLPVTNFPFNPNIDSVRINNTATSCSSFNFEGLGYTNTHPVASWQWNFGDNTMASTQNTSHTYTTSGNYPVKLIITDINGCKDSITTNIESGETNFDFNYDLDVCNPLTVQFNGLGSIITNPYWDFGDNSTTTGNQSVSHTYTSMGNYVVKYSVGNGVCTDTLTKTITVNVITDNSLVSTTDTTICFGINKQLRTNSSLSFCWSPTTYLDNPASSQPITSATENITYYFTAETTGNNLIVNGDFSQGNTGFTSEYGFSNPNTTEGQYFVGTNPQEWNVNLTVCGDHTTGTGNMMLVNGSPADNIKVWSQTVAVQPNTNYAFSAWLQDVAAENPARLQFSINGINMGPLLQASNTPCLWQQFSINWNSGSNTSAIISIVNKNLILTGNDFALDDISFAPVYIKRDSVKITVDSPFVKTNVDTVVCAKSPVQLNTTGAQTYSWTPLTNLSNSNIPNPVASPLIPTEYIVTGINVNGCIAKDSVMVDIFPAPAIAITNDTTICRNTSVQLSVSGGSEYNWSPSATLDDPLVSNPVASPVDDNTIYYVAITDNNDCSYIDSVIVSLKPEPVFTINNPVSTCLNDSIQLNASGGNVYNWQPAAGLSNARISNPKASPSTYTDYFVTITETACNHSAVLSTSVIVLSLPDIRASSSNDIDCSNDQSQLDATGGDRYVWTSSSSLNNSSIANPIARPVTTTQYIVKGTDASNCVNYDSVVVKVDSINKSGYFMPNAFTPNGDGLNDCFGIRYWGIIQELEFSIYNRWGERIFYTADPGQCWNGTYKGVKQNTDVFVYMIRAKTSCESAVFRKGTFTLIR